MKGYERILRIVDVVTVLVLGAYAGWSIAWHSDLCSTEPAQELWAVMMAVMVLRLVLAFIPKKWRT